MELPIEMTAISELIGKLGIKNYNTYVSNKGIEIYSVDSDILITAVSSDNGEDVTVSIEIKINDAYEKHFENGKTVYVKMENDK